MPIQVNRMTEADIDGAIDTIQQAFENDPYNNWVFPDRSKVNSPSPVIIHEILADSLPGIINSQSCLAHSPLPLGDPTWPLPRRPRYIRPFQDSRLRNVASPALSLRATVLVALSLILVALVRTDPYEPLVRSRRTIDKAVLDMESETSGGAK